MYAHVGELIVKQYIKMLGIDCNKKSWNLCYKPYIRMPRVPWNTAWWKWNPNQSDTGTFSLQTGNIFHNAISYSTDSKKPWMSQDLATLGNFAGWHFKHKHEGIASVL